MTFRFTRRRLFGTTLAATGAVLTGLGFAQGQTLTTKGKIMLDGYSPVWNRSDQRADSRQVGASPRCVRHCLFLMRRRWPGFSPSGFRGTLRTASDTAQTNAVK